MKNSRCNEMGGYPMPGEMPMEGYGMPMSNENMVYPGVECQPIYECPQEKIIHEQINHHVNHIQPVNTKIIKHHTYHHSVVPYFTCCEENVYCNVYDGCGRPR